MNEQARRMGRMALGAALAILSSSILLAAQEGEDPAKSSPEKGPGNVQARAKNVMVFIADGCGYNHVDAASLYREGKPGRLPQQHFPYRFAMTTYPKDGSYDPEQAWGSFDAVKTGYTDSAASATAMSTGVKTKNGAIGVDSDGNPLKHAIEYAEEMGKATGVVTSVQFSHATPAGFVAHNVSRGNYEEIAREMIQESAVDVIMGCGHPMFDGSGNAVDEPVEFQFVGGEETWDALLAGTAGGDANGDTIDDRWVLIQTRAEFQSLGEGEAPSRVIGVPQVRSTLQQGREGEKEAPPYTVDFIETVPTLAEMTRAALNVLDDDPEGFFVMVEGGAVDWASHGNLSGRAIEEAIAFTEAIEAAIDWVQANSSWGETLIIVTGDHETGYLTGPGSGQTETGPVWNPLVSNGEGTQPEMQWNSGGHTNQLIPFYAKGPGGNAFRWLVVGEDPVRGPYIDNTAIARVAIEVME